MASFHLLSIRIVPTSFGSSILQNKTDKTVGTRLWTFTNEYGYCTLNPEPMMVGKPFIIRDVNPETISMEGDAVPHGIINGFPTIIGSGSTSRISRFFIQRASGRPYRFVYQYVLATERAPLDWTGLSARSAKWYSRRSQRKGNGW